MWCIASSVKTGRTGSSRRRKRASCAACSAERKTMMRLLDFFRRPQKTASIAKDRLQIIVARERGATKAAPDYLPQLQQELLQVIAKYEKIDLSQVSVN